MTEDIKLKKPAPRKPAKKVKAVPANHRHDNWLQKNWRPLCALTYMLINLCDFVVMPAWVHSTNSRMDRESTIAQVKQLADSTAQVEAIRIFHGQEEWKPITLEGSGLIHIAFLTVLGVASWTRGQEKIARVTTPEQTEEKKDDE
jgi:hypothetical protein